MNLSTNTDSYQSNVTRGNVLQDEEDPRVLATLYLMHKIGKRSFQSFDSDKNVLHFAAFMRLQICGHPINSNFIHTNEHGTWRPDINKHFNMWT